MPYRRRRFARKRPVRRRRYVKKRKYVRKLKQQNNQINIKQTVRDLVTLETPQLDVDRPCYDEQFMLNQVPRHEEFKAMFDKYKINGVKLTFSLEGDTSDILETNGLSMVFRYDTDGHSVADSATVNTMLQAGNCKVVNFNQNKTRHSIFLKPNPLSPLYCGAATPFGYNAGARRGMWLDTNAENILHYGLEYGFMNPSNTMGQAVTLQIIKTYYLSFKGVIATTGASTTLTDTTNITVDPIPVTTDSSGISQQVAELMAAHDSDNDHDPSGNVSHPAAAYY
jgi:hypothetical protein